MLAISRVFVWLLISLLCWQTAAAQSPAPLHNSTVGIGTKQIARAWLANPTTRYQHFVLGDQYEASSLLVELKGGEILKHDLPQHLVFEDRHVRLADLNNDGMDEIIVVVSSASQGASLAVFKADQDISLLAQTPHIGLPFRWLNPAGIADFDGDGVLEIALVKKPHLTKRLVFWRLEGVNMKRIAAMEGYSNHRHGSRNQLMSATFDINKDGIVDLLLPDASRQVLRAITLVPKLKILKEWTLPAPVDGNFLLKEDGSSYMLELPLQDGSSHTITLQQN